MFGAFEVVHNRVVMVAYRYIKVGTVFFVNTVHGLRVMLTSKNISTTRRGVTGQYVTFITAFGTIQGMNKSHGHRID